MDGHSEASAIPTRLDGSSCKWSVLRRNINGKNASLERIAKDAAKKLNALNCRGAKLGFVIVDREEKDHTAKEMGEELSNLILNDYNGSFFVIIADRMFENWLVADLEGLKAKHQDLFKESAINGNYEGRHGASILKRHWKSQSSFSKNSYGAKFFKSIRLDIAKSNSGSLNYFLSLFDTHGVGYH